jgi:RNA polymerase sigma-70 factor (ECF subfamily)
VSDSLDAGSAEVVGQLTAGLARGDESAWRQFHDAYFNRLFRYLLVVLRGDEEATHEALQQTLIRVHRHVRRFETETVFWSWLCVLARSAARDGARGRNRYAALLASYASQWFGAIETTSDPTEPALSGCLDEVLGQLPPEERALLIAKYTGRRTVADLALESGTTSKAVESRLARIRSRLRTELLKRLRHEDPT